MEEVRIIDGKLPEELTKQIRSLETQAKEIAEKQKKMKEAILNAMKENDIIKLENEEIAIAYIAPSTQEKLDTKALRADLPDIYDTYCKITPRADYIKITLKEKKDGELDD